MDYRVISIGTLSHNHVWGESGAVRTSHATTTLVEAGEQRILVDPSLPEAALAARFNERTGKTLAAVTDVFCTTLRPVHRRALEALAQANWWVMEEEIESYRDHLAHLRESAQRLSADDARQLEAELKLLQKFKPAPETLAPQVQLYPLKGASVGSAGLLLTPAMQTVLIAGDAAITADHVQRGQIWEGCADTQQAMETLEDILQVADIIIPGPDNIMLSPKGQMF